MLLPSHWREERMVFIRLTMASIVGPRVSSLSWCTSSIRKSLTNWTRDLWSRHLRVILSHFSCKLKFFLLTVTCDSLPRYCTKSNLVQHSQARQQLFSSVRHDYLQTLQCTLTPTYGGSHDDLCIL